MLKVGWNGCPFCGRQDIYISRPKSLWEEVAVIALLQPVRCHDCMRRFFRPLLASPRPQIDVKRRASVTKVLTQQEAAAKDRSRAA